MVNIIKKAWASSPPLTFTALLMLVAFPVSAAGIFLDPRTITGVPAWLKPTKFAISSAIYCGSLAWIYGYLNVWPRILHVAAWATSLIITVEVALIDVQAARGTTSHFNASTPFDAAVFTVMGVMIALAWFASAGILAASFKQTFRDRAWGWSLRLGLLATVLGSATGGLMVRPTPEQMDRMHRHEGVTAVGAHTVGAPDGGPGIPGVGWSTADGDVRIPHFFGLHGLQIIPFLGWLISRRRGQDQIKLVFTTAASYLTFVAILVWQALRGQSILEPDLSTIVALAVWLIATAAAVLAFRRTPVEAIA
jgi:hypothetical protein